MIIFIDLTNQIANGEKCFAFFDTTTDRFLDINREQVWDDMDDFKWCAIEASKGELTPERAERLIALIPENF